MSDYNDNDDTLDDDTEQPEANSKNFRRRLEAEAAEGRQAKAEAEQARRELAFVKAGIDTDSPLGKLFAKAYDGATTVDAVRAAATEAGIVQPEQPAIPAEELAGHDRIASAASGSDQPSDEQGYFAELQAASNPAEVLAVLAKAGIPVDNSKPGTWHRSESMGSLPLQ